MKNEVKKKILDAMDAIQEYSLDGDRNVADTISAGLCVAMEEINRLELEIRLKEV